MNINEIMANLEAKHPGEKEFLQAVHEVLESEKRFTTSTPSLRKPKS